jgi:hypothetical protein
MKSRKEAPINGSADGYPRISASLGLAYTGGVLYGNHGGFDPPSAAILAQKPNFSFPPAGSLDGGDHGTQDVLPVLRSVKQAHGPSDHFLAAVAVETLRAGVPVHDSPVRIRDDHRIEVILPGPDVGPLDQVVEVQLVGRAAFGRASMGFRCSLEGGQPWTSLDASTGGAGPGATLTRSGSVREAPERPDRSGVLYTRQGCRCSRRHAVSTGAASRASGAPDLPRTGKGGPGHRLPGSEQAARFRAHPPTVIRRLQA